MPIALVTGASGFTGRYMIDALKKRGFTVTGLGSESTNADETLACDLTDMEAVRVLVKKIQPDWVIHLAALAFVGHADQEAFYRVNVFGTLNLLAALSEQQKTPRRVLLASSANIYGTPGVEVINEDISPAPVNHYACSKLAMEHMAATWFERLPIVIARPFNYTGPGQNENFLIPKIVSHFAQRKPVIELGNLDVSRDFSDVRDVVDAYVRLLDSNVCSQRINICSGHAVSLREIISLMEAIAKYRIKVEVNPAFVRANEIPVLRGDNQRLLAATGFAPRQSLKQTLEDMLSAAQAN